MDAQLRLQIIHAVALREGTARELAERFSMPVPALRAFVTEYEDSIRHIAEEAEWEAQRAAEEAEEAKQRKTQRKTRLVAAGFGETNLESAFPDDLVLPEDLDVLWISKKTERLKRYQIIADLLFTMANNGSTDATVLRELRSFMRYAAEELGQLLHRGSGDMPENSTVNYTLPGVNMEDLT